MTTLAGSQPPPPKEPHKLELDKDGKIPLSEVFRLMGSYNIYQDQIGWSRTQTLVIVEAAILAGAFARQGPLSPIILVVGAFLVGGIYLVIRRDWQVRDHFGDELKCMFKSLGREFVPKRKGCRLRGREFVVAVSWSVIAINLVLAGLKASLLPWHCFDSWTVEFWLR